MARFFPALAAGLVLLPAAALLGWRTETARAQPRRPAVSARAHRARVLYLSAPSRGVPWDLYAMNADGTGAAALTRDSALELDPVLSPDGSRIALSVMADPNALSSDLYLLNADGTGRRPLTHQPRGSLAVSPSWSPDGLWITYCTVPWRGGEPEWSRAELRRVHAAGWPDERLGAGGLPCWSPDGAELLFTLQHRDTPPRLYRQARAGGAPAPLRPETREAAWSPDGCRLAFLREARGGWGREIWLSEASGTGARRLLRLPQASPAGLQWTPDGRLLYTRYEGTDYYGAYMGVGSRASLWLLDPATGRTRRLTPDPSFAFTGSPALGAFSASVYGFTTFTPRPIDRDLINVLMASDTEKARSLLEAGADPNTRWRYIGFPALQLAVVRGDVELVRQMLDRGADVNATYPRGGSVLELSGSTRMLRLLLERGADAKQPTASNRSPLLTAVDNGSLASARLLLEHGADPNAADPVGNTALMHSALRGSPALTRLLLEHGARPDALSAYGQTPLLCAVSARRRDILSLLLERGAPVDQRGRNGRTALMLAAAAGALPEAGALLHAGADPLLRDGSGRTARRIAEGQHRPALARLLASAEQKSSNKTARSGAPM